MNNFNEYSIFNDKALIKALELLVSRQDLKNREVAEAILNAFGFSQSDIIEQLRLNEYLEDITPRSRLNLVRI